jgi:hypothetical protein
MYDRGRHAPWWQEAFVLTRAVFGILFWPLLALMAVVVAIFGLFVAFNAGVLWGVLVLALIATAVAAFAWWDRRQPPRT